MRWIGCDQCEQSICQCPLELPPLSGFCKLCRVCFANTLESLLNLMMLRYIVVSTVVECPVLWNLLCHCVGASNAETILILPVKGIAHLMSGPVWSWRQDELLKVLGQPTLA